MSDIKDSDSISLIRKGRDSRGGGVAIAYDESKIKLGKVSLNSLKKSKFEIVAAAGKLIGIKKNHLIFSCYLPPSYNRDKTAAFFETLVDAVSEAKAKCPDSWLTIGGTGMRGPFPQ